MADVFEQNLPSKANLSVATNGDYLRVVGSDNNSYKQLVNDVAKKIIENYTNSSLAGANQSVKAALDSLNSNFHIDIPANTDLDTLTTVGFYGCSSNAIAQTLINCPSEYSFVMLVISKNTLGTLPIQILTNGTFTYTRTKATSGWADWYNVDKAENSNWHINLVAGQDLNDITGRGFYDCPTSAIAQSLVNCPTTNNFVMQAMTKGAYCTQIIFTGDKMFLRTQVSSGWSSWYMFTATAV